MSGLFDSLAQSMPASQLELQQSNFLQEGIQEQQYLKQENERLRTVCAALLRSRKVTTLIQPFADHA